jgi:mevalonate kinase
MQKSKTIFVLSAVVVVLTVFAGLAHAETETGRSFQVPFVGALAERLDMDEEELNVIVEEVREEHRVEMHNQRTERIQEAFEEGKLTEKQMQILEAKEEYRGGAQNRQKGAMLEMLNEKGLDVTHEEMQELSSLMRELGIGGKMQGRQMHNR